MAARAPARRAYAHDPPLWNEIRFRDLRIDERASEARKSLRAIWLECTYPSVDNAAKLPKRNRQRTARPFQRIGVDCEPRGVLYALDRLAVDRDARSLRRSLHRLRIRVHGFRGGGSAQ